MRKFIIGGLAAFAMVAVPAAVGLTAPANASPTTKCSTHLGLYGPTSNTYTDDGGRYITTTYCDGNGNGNCTTD